MRGRQLIFGFMIVAAIAIAGCTRSATTNPTALPVVGETSVAPQETAEAENIPSEMQTALAGGLATQTAMAEAEAGGGQAEATEAPQQEGESEATEASAAAEEPTKTPKPTKKPEKETCKSPYTVKKGEWVWSIGRKCNIDPPSIISENNLVYPYTIYPGQKLVFPNNPPPFRGP